MTGKESGWRLLRPAERAVLDRLLSEPFPGRDEVRVQLVAARVRTIGLEGSLEFLVGGPSADIQSRVPISARYLDAPGDDFSPHVNLLLHVVHGSAHELEVYKDDGTPIRLGAYEVEIARIQTY